MRTLKTHLALFLALMAPLAAVAGHPHRGGGMIFVQPPSYRKAQTITPENQALVQARQQKLAKLKADLEAIAPRAMPTKEQTTALYQDLLAVVDGSNKPAPASVLKLSTDLSTVMAHRSAKASLDTLVLAKSLKVVMNSAYVMALDSHMATRKSQELLKAVGAADTETKAVVSDLEKIASQAAAQGRPGMIR